VSFIREPDGVDFVVSETVTDRETLLDIADWLNAYRRQHDQSEELEKAMQIVRRASEQNRPAPPAPPDASK